MKDYDFGLRDVTIEFTMAIQGVGEAAERSRRAFDDFLFSLWVLDQPRWQRPLMRFAYWVERKVLR